MTSSLRYAAPACTLMLLTSGPLAAEHVTFEAGSYRNKSVLYYDHQTLSLSKVDSGKTISVCEQGISAETLSHTLAFFKTLDIQSWQPDYFSERLKGGNIFTLDIQIANITKKSAGHSHLAPARYDKIIRHFNQVLTVNNCPVIN
ncbi:hypothetical protein CWB99_14370 [Pseudoalteromonas rubra]|uniref:Uncharacterized protein n=1 Tax=Pseudoalteromonas rubra TaxID=43658 RepID=A0A5S3WK79_9GAMM|nr:hypothetical protein [Pseudoalteromonas rubra]TMP27634.1 hypothetical protein CWB99_14370 [Pseudoalteromonas rubra]TMP28883.1 hypothetical protein CWC00_20150 [Pseudoalteromonas rubra]